MLYCYHLPPLTENWFVYQKKKKKVFIITLAEMKGTRFVCPPVNIKEVGMEK